MGKREVPQWGKDMANFLSDPVKLEAAISPRTVEGIRKLNQWIRDSKGKTPIPYGTPNPLYDGKTGVVA